MGKTEGKPLGVTVKETVDYIYNYLLPFPDGITMNAGHLGKNGSRVCTSLVNRGIITKTKKGRQFKYKWVATMGPTRVLIGGITDELTGKNREYGKTHRDKTKKEKDMKQIETEREKQEAGVVLDNRSIQQYTIQELWDEIKRKGGYIKDNRLAVTTYID